MRLGWRDWFLVLVYALGYWASRKLSIDQWYLPSGLRFALLLVLPYRHWKYVFIGEAVCIAALFYDKAISMYGLSWLFISSTTVMPAASVCVYALRRLSSLPSLKKPSDLITFLIAAAASTALTTLVNRLTVAWFMNKTPSYHPHSVATYLLGDYLAILIFTPIVLISFNYQSIISKPRKLLVDVVSVVIPIISLLIGASLLLSPTYDDLSQGARFAMTLPALWLATRHGWSGIAVSAFLVSIGIRLSQPGLEDIVTFQSQKFVAAFLTISMVLGSKISDLHENIAQSGSNAVRSREIARHGYQYCEEKLQKSANMAVRAYEVMQRATNMIVADLKSEGLSSLAMTFNRLYLAEARIAANRVVNTLYPIYLNAHGLFAAVKMSLSHDFLTNQTKLTINLRGDADTLTKELQLEVYRIAYDVMQLASKNSPTWIRLYIRVIGRQDKNCIVIRICRGGAADNLSTAHSMLVDRIRGRIELLNGLIHTKRQSFSVLLHEQFSD